MSDSAAIDDRLHILLDQYGAAWEMLDARLTGRAPFREHEGSLETNLTDEEYFWEPVPGCLSIRRREEAPTESVAGKGDWVIERYTGAPQQAPVTTIAWRLCHLVWGQMMRYDYTFGDHKLATDDFEWPSTARDAVALLRQSHEQWRDGLTGMSSEELDQIGRSQMPHGLDPHVRFVDLLAWTNVEYAHHAAEIGCLRDLHRAQFS